MGGFSAAIAFSACSHRSRRGVPLNLGIYLCVHRRLSIAQSPEQVKGKMNGLPPLTCSVLRATLCLADELRDISQSPRTRLVYFSFLHKWEKGSFRATLLSFLTFLPFRVIVGLDDSVLLFAVYLDSESRREGFRCRGDLFSACLRVVTSTSGCFRPRLVRKIFIPGGYMNRRAPFTNFF